MDWLDENLIFEIKRVFEPKYCKKLSLTEVHIIASNLTAYFENYTKFKMNIKNETGI
jgi:hypothetical protein